MQHEQSVDVHRSVLGNHLRSARLGVDAVMDDYTDQSVLMTHHATYRGRAEIRLFFTALFEASPPGSSRRCGCAGRR